MWGSSYSEDALLEPTDPLFQTLGQLFYQTLTNTYGSDHFFNADTYNEMDPSSTELSFLAASNKAVYTAMTSVDPDATFVMQVNGGVARCLPMGVGIEMGATPCGVSVPSERHASFHCPVSDSVRR